MAFDISGWYDEIKKGDVLVHHKGAISAELITRVLEHIESELTERNEKGKIKKKVYNVMVEALQNLFHHTENAPKSLKLGENIEKFAIFVLKKDILGGVYNFICGNFIFKSKEKFLKDRLDQINYLTIAELKILYQLILNNDEFSDKGGGGLGLIDIAKRTGEKFNYQFYKQFGELNFFCLNIKIPN